MGHVGKELDALMLRSSKGWQVSPDNLLVQFFEKIQSKIKSSGN
jgi:hypothetical protein